MQPRSPVEASSYAMLSGDERGAAAIEHALICALIALAIVATITGVGASNAKAFNSVTTQLDTSGNGHGKGGGNSGNGKGNGGPVAP